MTTEPTAPLDDRVFDLLVDGELNEAARRELLSRLDREPDGWRRCALAFLEAQTWRSGLAYEVHESPAAPAALRRTTEGHSLRRIRSIVNRLWLSAAVLVAFGLGWIVRSAPPALAPLASGKGQETAPEPLTTTKSRPLEQDDTHDAAAPAAAADEVRLAGTIRWRLEQDGQQEEIEIPVLEGPGIDLQRLIEQPPAMSEPARLALERRGHKVETHRQLLTVNLKDGRSVVVPVDQVHVQFAGRVFQ
jgi:hypothetical protein